ncbi:IS110 family transposase, partial [Pseudovibrio sp. W64]|uniref:IS110 family transposase n=2 Tax=unclassified Pseudovibrio TaxID=2627060 RepID=UPI00187BD33A
MEYYAGLDVSLRSVPICVINGEGKIVFEHSVACEVDVIASTLTKASLPITRIGFEAGTMSQPLFYGLKEQHGFDVVCMEARQVNAALSAMRNKTDKNDARGIAQVLRSGWYSPVHMKSRRSHAMRTLLSSRKACLRKCIDLTNEVRGLLKVYGLRLPERIKHTRFDATVQPFIEVHPDLSLALVPLLDARLALLHTYQELDKRVKHAASTNAVCLRLMEIPGVGPMTALAFVAAVDDPARFRSSRTVAAHFGLTPRRFQSGETDNPDRISKA